MILLFDIFNDLESSNMPNLLYFSIMLIVIEDEFKDKIIHKYM